MVPRGSALFGCRALSALREGASSAGVLNRAYPVASGPSVNLATLPRRRGSSAGDVHRLEQPVYVAVPSNAFDDRCPELPLSQKVETVLRRRHPPGLCR